MCPPDDLVTCSMVRQALRSEIDLHVAFGDAAMVVNDADQMGTFGGRTPGKRAGAIRSPAYLFRVRPPSLYVRDDRSAREQLSEAVTRISQARKTIFDRLELLLPAAHSAHGMDN